MCTCVRSAQVWSQRQEDSCGSVQRVLQQVSCGWTGHSEFACTRLCSHQLAQTLSVCVTHCLARLSWPKTRHPPRVRTRSHSTVPQQHTTPPHLNCCSSHACSPRPPCTLAFLALSNSLARLPAVSYSCDQVQHCGGGFGGAGADGGSSSNAANCIDAWLGGKQWDVVTVNVGLDDCEAPGGGGFNVAAYSTNVRVVLTKAAASARRVVFVSTTPVGGTSSTNSATRACVLQANAAARQVVAEVNATTAANGRVAFADIFSHVESFCSANYTNCAVQLDGGNAHFSTAWTPPWPTDPATKQPLQSGPKPSGQQFTGLFLAREIQRAVPADKIHPPINASVAAASTSRSGLRWGVLDAALTDGGGGALPCGIPPPALLNTSVPNVLIIGDSVSDTGSGYGPSVRVLLETSTGNDNLVGSAWLCLTPSPVLLSPSFVLCAQLTFCPTPSLQQQLEC
jgi:hypothetical protein